MSNTFLSLSISAVLIRIAVVYDLDDDSSRDSVSGKRKSPRFVPFVVGGDSVALRAWSPRKPRPDWPAML